MARHARFSELSPEVGELDVDAVREAVADDPDTVLPLLALMSRATDPELRRKVQSLVPRLVIDRARAGPHGKIGSGRLRPVPADRGGDLDLDSSMESVAAAYAAGRSPRLDELVASAWQRPGTALCLLIDRSGSMEGAQLATAAMAAAACALRSNQSGGELSIVAFDRRAEVIVPLTAPTGVDKAVEQVLGLRGHGMTSIDAALRCAREQLAGARAKRRITVLLSDCRVTDDVDPVPSARALDELLVIAPAADADAARGLAAESGARVAELDRLVDLPRILDDLLAP
ncbi:VWA domain-containing protein [Gordonia sp. TBRC 11910]|uniref:VWA domain-containing protein n=1 Tax=Gordonia asplenii TaxID=2725283 RepID=A0A848KWI4_9ACTN|nr:vWA domain-containing protein [Gordonia asplenii]NMO03194.1 VWA domain-containing protein [Gordonia asplenii]